MALENGLTASDIMAITKDNEGLFGGGAGGILALIIVFILLFGGNGMWGNNNGTQYATQQGVQNSFDTNTIVSKIDALGNGICDSGYANAQLINGINTSILQQTSQIGFGISDVNYAVQSQSCGINRNIDSLRYDAQLNTRDITDAIHSEGEATRAMITQNEITQLRTDLQSAQLALSNANQTQNITSTILDSIGRYVTNPPCYNGYTCSCNSGVTVG